MNIKQQIEQVIATLNTIASDIARADIAGFGNQVSFTADHLATIMEQMEADEQAIVDEINKRWPTGKPQPDDMFVGAAQQVPDGMVLVSPEGEVIGPCVCGGWSGGKCLRCKVVSNAELSGRPLADGPA